ncbi:FAD-binding oxidoreductase [Actinomadura hibisca]|uniref:FAD-binding oxidoreductase n=1 Tax=Actinomadura hibisca TaxID=68565 RepID=UPI00083656B7|nr:FAD-binding oxidoreductase [Actinomadura hibisca]
MSDVRTRALTGWGRTSPTTARVAAPRNPAEVHERLIGRTDRGVIARGLGRSYGDPAQNAGGTVIDMTGLDRVLDLDLERGLVTCQAGLSLHRLMELVLPFGWFVPVTPGTRHVTIGGAIGSDIHGKNHHADGAFAQHVERFELLQADGTVRQVSPESDPETFWATAGGMGLTGIVLSAVLRLIPVETAWMKVDVARCADLDDVMARMADGDASRRYSVAWLDCLATGASLGRSVLECGEHAALADLPARPARDPLRFRPRTLGGVPSALPGGLLGRHSIALFNETWYRKAPRRKDGHLKTIAGFFHPLDGVRDWNRMYGPAGFLQYQFVVPFGAERTLRRIVESISAAGAPSFLTVLKRFGPGDPGHLSFPIEGWTLALDFPAATPGLAALLDGFDRQVAEAGGRVYLAKDSRMAPDLVPHMYPRLAEFRQARSTLDPDGVFVSDLARRLAL